MFSSEQSCKQFVIIMIIMVTVAVISAVSVSQEIFAGLGEASGCKIQGELVF